MMLGLLIYILLIHTLNNCLRSHLLNYLSAVILKIILVYFSVHVKNQLRCFAAVTFACELIFM